MRKTVYSRLAVFCLLLFGGLCYCSPSRPETARPLAAGFPEPAAMIPIEISVDPRVELFSIIFRLAGNPEYSRGGSGSYTQEVERQFGAFRRHPAVLYASQLRASRGIGFDAPMSLAVHISSAFGLPLNPLPSDLDSRWTSGNAREFLSKARQFSKDTDFGAFFSRQQPRYRQALEAMQQFLAEKNRLGWFNDFFGTQTRPDFHLVLALLNGGSNYGPSAKIGDGEEIYCILGVSQQDASGRVQFDQDVIYIIVHEFAHSYANPLVDRHLAELRPAGVKLFARAKDQMARQGYGSWETMMRESLVRASVVRYAGDIDGPDAAEKRARDEAARGFVWTKALAQLLTEYEADRKTYPDLEAFFPNIVTFFDEYEPGK